MRSCVIAEELICRGHEVIFIGNTSEIPWINEYVNGLGFSQIFQAAAGFVSNPNSDVLILDSYEIDSSTTFIQPVNWHKVVVLVDDETPQYSAKLYIHPGPGTRWKPPDAKTEFQFISGIEYLLIRKSIRELAPASSIGKIRDLNILIVGGGSDPTNFCKSLIEKLSLIPFDFEACVIAKELNIASIDERFRILNFGIEIEDLLKRADLVLTTAGTTSWEVLSVGITTGVACAMNNQRPNYIFQTSNAMAIGIGEFSSKGIWYFDQSALEILIKNGHKMEQAGSPVNRLWIGRGLTTLMGLILT